MCAKSASEMRKHLYTRKVRHIEVLNTRNNGLNRPGSLGRSDLA